MNTQLYIEGYEIELDKSVQFAITKQFEDVNNPTTIINDWSKTVSIPFTEHNNKVFGYLFRNDLSQNNLDLAPDKKLNFILLYNNSLLMNGYCKINSITRNSGKGTYNINLFGKIGEVFSELNKITCSYTDNEGDKYYIGNLFNTFINKELVHKSWNKEKPKYYLNEIEDNTDVIGFSCSNNGFNKDFNSKSIQISNSEIVDLKDYQVTWVDKDGTTRTTSLKEKYEYCGYSYDTINGDGLLPRQLGEFRSYYQTPYIYVPKMFQLLQQKCSELTDYSIELDDEWFNEENPYYGKLVMMLNRLNTTSNKTINNTYNYKSQPSKSVLIDEISILPKSFTYSFTNKGSDSNNLGSDSKTFTNINYFTKITGTLKVGLHIGALISGNIISIAKNNAIIAKIKIGNVIKEIAIISMYADETFDENIRNLYDDVIYVGSFGNVNNEGIMVADSVGFELYTSTQEKQFTVDVEYRWLQDGYTIWNETTEQYGSIPVNLFEWNSGYNYQETGIYNLKFEYTDAIRSNWEFSLKDVWDCKVGLFEQCLRYTKMYNLVWVTDDTNKKLKCMSKQKYFSKYTITDWTDKVDLSKDFNIQPITFDNKYYLFNYTDDDCKTNEEYEKQNNANFGEIKVNTNYAFNSESKDLFNGIQTSIITTDNILEPINFTNYELVYNIGEALPELYDKDNKPINGFGRFFLQNGLGRFKASTLRTVLISDDTPLQIKQNNYVYIERNLNFDDYFKASSYYPLLTDVYSTSTKKLMCLYNVPNTCYKYGSDYNNSYGIYQEIWKDYIEKELYNPDNHKLTCYVALNNLDFQNFNFNNFVTINNVLYLVNKICDYSPDNVLTKCELIKVHNPNNYSENTYSKFDKLPYLTCSSYNVIVTNSSLTINYSSSSDISLSSDSSLVILTKTDTTITATLRISTITKFNITVTNTEGVSKVIHIEIKQPTHINGEIK